MKLLLELYPGDFWALLTANVLLQIAVVVLLACVLVVGIARRAPATRHAIWLCALVCVVCSPILAFTLNGLGITLIPVRLLLEVKSDAPIAAVDRETSVATARAVPSRAAPETSDLQRSFHSEASEPKGQATNGNSAQTPIPPASLLASTLFSSSRARQLSTGDRLRALGGGQVAVWGMGVIVVLIRLSRGWWMLAQLAQETSPIDNPAVNRVLGGICRTQTAGRISTAA